MSRAGDTSDFFAALRRNALWYASVIGLKKHLDERVLLRGTHERCSIDCSVHFGDPSCRPIGKNPSRDLVCFYREHVALMEFPFSPARVGLWITGIPLGGHIDFLESRQHPFSTLGDGKGESVLCLTSIYRYDIYINDI